MFGKITNYFVSAYAELKKVIWPSRKEIISHTTIVVFSILISMGVIAALDFGLFSILEILIYK